MASLHVLRMLFLAMVNNFSLNSSSEIPGLLQPSCLLASLEKEGQSFTKFPTRNSGWGLCGTISYWNGIMITPTQIIQSLPLHVQKKKICGLHILRLIAEDEPVAGWIYVRQVSFKMHKSCLIRIFSRYLSSAIQFCAAAEGAVWIEIAGYEYGWRKLL